MKISLSLVAVLLGLASVAGCNNDKQKDDKKLEKSSDASGFALKAEICGSFVSLADYANKEDGRRQASIEIAMGVCGKIGNAGHTWSALGMRLATPEIYLKKPGAAFTGEKYEVYIEGEKSIYAVKGATKVLLGTIKTVQSGEPVQLANGVIAELAIGNRAYQISDAKTLPDSEKRLFFSVN